MIIPFFKSNVAQLCLKSFFFNVFFLRNKELIRVFKDVDLIENIGSGVLRILDAYDTATISRCLKQLQYKKIIERVGSNKSGYWKIIENNDI